MQDMHLLKVLTELWPISYLIWEVFQARFMGLTRLHKGYRIAIT